MLPCNRDDPAIIRPAGQIPGRIMRKINNHQPCIWPDVVLEEIRIEVPAILFFRLPAGDFTAHAFSNLVERLVAWKGANYVIARLEDAVHGYEDAFLRHNHQAILRADAVVEVGNFLSKLRVTQGFGVAEGQLIPKFPNFRDGICHQFRLR